MRVRIILASPFWWNLHQIRDSPEDKVHSSLNSEINNHPFAVFFACGATETNLPWTKELYWPLGQVTSLKEGAPLEVHPLGYHISPPCASMIPPSLKTIH
jgi:hypothetical protein